MEEFNEMNILVDNILSTDSKISEYWEDNINSKACIISNDIVLSKLQLKKAASLEKLKLIDKNMHDKLQEILQEA